MGYRQKRPGALPVCFLASGCVMIPQNANKIQANGVLPRLQKTTHFSTYPQMEKTAVVEKTNK
ncbi:hypothetical protein P0D71_28100 [Paraburkholderia sp. RL17-383-BIF-A]|uniref:hypothetical protein n=1 Tax=Paraburkholderia sp. RL17-383-BIF-A TaxID=3031631 RepID=UPI0038BA3C85